MTQIRETNSILDAPTRRTLRRKVFVKSYGCQMNAYDSQRMTDVLAPHGYDETSVVEDADLVILNTCHIRERATEKVFSELGKLRLLKQERHQVAGETTRLVVAGCVAQAEGAEILRREKAVDIVVGPQSYHRLPHLLADADAGHRPIDTEFDSADKFGRLPHPSAHRIRARGPSAFVTIQEGCDKFCSFCVVPYTRGAEVSRPIATIMGDARALARSGVREITLLGQNVNAYHGLDEHGRASHLAALCRRLATIEGLDRIRYTTSHPNDFSDDLIAAHAELPALMPFVHLPVQSGSDRILRAMNRKHTVASYVDRVDRLRQARPDIALSSDFIVGFPGETDADFEATLDLIRTVGFAAAFSFKYSPRPGTPAADRPGQVAAEVMKVRLASLQALVEAQRQRFNAACVGRTFEVLLERPGRHAGQLTGKSPYLQQIQVDADASLKGHVVPVKIDAVGANSLFGSLERVPTGWTHPVDKDPLPFNKLEHVPTAKPASTFAGHALAGPHLREA